MDQATAVYKALRPSLAKLSRQLLPRLRSAAQNIGSACSNNPALTLTLAGVTMVLGSCMLLALAVAIVQFSILLGIAFIVAGALSRDQKHSGFFSNLLAEQMASFRQGTASEDIPVPAYEEKNSDWGSVTRANMIAPEFNFTT